MYIPPIDVALQYAELSQSKSIRSAAKKMSDDDDTFFISFFEMTVSYAKEKYANTSTLFIIETKLRGLYAPFLNEINETVQIVDGQPVLIDGKLLIIN